MAHWPLLYGKAGFVYELSNVRKWVEKIWLNFMFTFDC